MASPTQGPEFEQTPGDDGGQRNVCWRGGEMSSVLLGGAEGEERFGASVAVLPMTLFPLELILFRIDWCGFPAVQGTVKNLLHNLSTTI